MTYSSLNNFVIDISEEKILQFLLFFSSFRNKLLFLNIWKVRKKVVIKLTQNGPQILLKINVF